MSKKSSTTSSQRTDLSKFCAFWGITIAAIMYIAGGIIRLIIRFANDLFGAGVAGVLNTVCTVMSFLGSLALLVGIAIPAYRYVSGKKKGWKIFYWIVLAIYACGIVFGLIPAF